MNDFIDGNSNATQIKESTSDKINRNFVPIYTVKESLAFCSKIYTDLGMGAHHDKMSIAEVHKSAYNTIKQKFSSAISYDFLEIKRGIGYKLTHHFLKVHKPENDLERKKAIGESIQAVEFYEPLLKEFSGNHIPTEQGLSARFLRQNMREQLAKRVAVVFLSNIKDNGFVENEILKLGYGINAHTINNNESEKPTTAEQLTANTSEVSKASQNELQPSAFIEIPIPLKGGKRAYLRIPEEYTTEDCERIAKFVEALK